MKAICAIDPFLWTFRVAIIKLADYIFANYCKVNKHIDNIFCKLLIIRKVTSFSRPKKGQPLQAELTLFGLAQSSHTFVMGRTLTTVFGLTQNSHTFVMGRTLTIWPCAELSHFCHGQNSHYLALHRTLTIWHCAELSLFIVMRRTLTIWPSAKLSHSFVMRRTLTIRP